jgi:hypothetical protein
MNKLFALLVAVLCFVSWSTPTITPTAPPARPVVVPGPQVIEAGRPRGNAVPVFALGAGADVATHGLNRTVLAEGWVAAVDTVFLPRVIEWYGPPEKKTGPPRRVIVHLPFGRSEFTTPGAADMPFDGLLRLKERVETGSAELAKAADANAFVRAWARLAVRGDAELEFYLGTVDAGHRERWDSYSPAEWSKRAEQTLGVFRRIQTLSGKPVRVYLDAGGTRGPGSNSWEMRLTIRRMDLRCGVEPWPSLDGPQWAADPDVDVLITSQLFDHRGKWAVPRESIKGRITILYTGGRIDAAAEARIDGWLADGYDVALGAFRVEKSAAEWAAVGAKEVVE